MSNSYYHKIFFLLTFFAMIVVYVSLVIYSINNTGLHSDEGFYAIAAQNAINGKILYRDFGYNQMPILPYLNGAMMKIFGFGLTQQRFSNILWCSGSLIAFMWFLQCRCNYFTSLTAGWLLISSPIWVWGNCFQAVGSANFFIMLSGITICMPGNYYKKMVLFSIAGSLAIGCRMPVAPTIIILWIYLISQGIRPKDKIITIVSFPGICILLLVPFYIASPDNFIFWNFEYNLGKDFKEKFIASHFLLAPTTFLLMTCGLFSIMTDFKKIKSPEAGSLMAAVIGVASQLALNVSYFVYSIPFVALGTMGASVILSKSKWLRIIFPIFLLFPLSYLTPLSPITYLSLDEFIDNKWVDTLNNTVKFIHKKVPLDGKILTPYPIVAFQAGRNVIKGTEMGKFGITDEIGEVKAKNFHLKTHKQLIKLIDTLEPDVVILTNNLLHPYNFSLSVPSLNDIRTKKRVQFFDTLSKYYYIGFFESPLLVFLPKKNHNKNYNYSHLKMTFVSEPIEKKDTKTIDTKTIIFDVISKNDLDKIIKDYKKM